MPLRRKLGIAAIVLLAIAVGWFASDNFRLFVLFAGRVAYFAVHPSPPQCKKRAAEFQAKVELIRRDAKNSLEVGTTKESVVRFFASENIPLAFDQIGQDREATGSVYFEGLAECENVACGDDSARIGVHVKIDSDGTVVSDPVVIGGYANCM